MPERRVAESNLRRPRGVESRQDHPSLVRDAVAGRVLEVEKIGSAGDEDAAVPGHDAVRRRELAGEVRPLVEASVAVCVLQQGDDALGRRLSGALERAGIPAILDDEHAAPFVERHRHRVPDQGLRGRQFDPVARLELEADQRFVRRKAGVDPGRRRSARGGLRRISRAIRTWRFIYLSCASISSSGSTIFGAAWTSTWLVPSHVS